jgi:hypothetical protein
MAESSWNTLYISYINAYEMRTTLTDLIKFLIWLRAQGLYKNRQ